MTTFQNMSDAELAKRCAEAMGYRAEIVFDPMKNFQFVNYVDLWGVGWMRPEGWNPCVNYNDARIFEDFLSRDLRLWAAFSIYLNQIPMCGANLRSTARQRVIAGLMAIESEKGEIKLTNSIVHSRDKDDPMRFE